MEQFWIERIYSLIQRNIAIDRSIKELEIQKLNNCEKLEKIKHLLMLHPEDFQPTPETSAQVSPAHSSFSGRSQNSIEKEINSSEEEIVISDDDD